MSRLVLFIYGIGYRLYSLKVPILPKVIQYFIRVVFGSYIGMGAKFGKDVWMLSGGIGVVINSKAVIGNNVIIHQNVSIGDNGKSLDAPVIGDNTKISAGVVIIGGVKVGKNCVIGANAVVTTDIPPNSVAVGIPAKVIKRDIDIDDYR
jgi:serine O-acetyltransferase